MTLDPVADRYRRWGHLRADLDWLGRIQPVTHAEIAAVDGADAERWSAIYCGRVGAEFMHMADSERTAWIAARMESDPAPVDSRHLLARLVDSELFERFLHSRYVGSKRYSLEGAAGLISLLDGILHAAAAQEMERVLIAMSHRGRLTVMTQVVGTPPSQIFAGYEDFEHRSVLGSGDVKYHLGATGTYVCPSGARLQTHLVSNPSHLEAVDPVHQGRVRARQQRRGPDARRQIFGITIHGDAAFAGQGIAAETLNMSHLPGYDIGGTIHIIVNNLIGFTAEPPALHSSRYASDIAKRLEIPILHVNGEDPEAVYRVGQMALDYRFTFQSDIVIDLIGYRRYGHSEVDDPTVTQPLLYRIIDARPQLWESYADRLGVGETERNEMQERVLERLATEQDLGRSGKKKPVLRTLPPWWSAYVGGRYSPEFEVETGASVATLESLGASLASAPPEFTVHPKLQRLLEQRGEMARGDRPIDWAMAELLAFGTLLRDGMLVRLTGQDVRRGTFNQRHAALQDQQNGTSWVALDQLGEGAGRFEIYDSPLSEAAVLGFEYGFSRDWPDGLVCWEAQFGDFANGAQIILDQFLSAGEDKWQLLSGVVALLPHGFEGQGPEHSSARLERCLQLAAEDNIQVCQPTTAAQYFHLLRRQALRRWRKPLLVMTPKGNLRAPAVASPRAEFLQGRFRTVLGDEIAPDGVRRVLVCSGKIAHELRAERARRAEQRAAIVTLEQLYPFPESELGPELKRYPNAEQVVWVQEEPANMGGLFFVRPLLQRLAGSGHVTSVKRSASASPATGSTKAHALEQSTLIELAFASFD